LDGEMTVVEKRIHIKKNLRSMASSGKEERESQDKDQIIKELQNQLNAKNEELEKINEKMDK
jgi:hypothetical protein